MPNGSDLGNLGGAGLGAPGQRVSRQETAKSETRLPIAQCMVASVALLIIYAVLLLAVAIAGPVVAIVAGYGLMLYMAILALMRLESAPARLWASVIIVGAITIWALYGGPVAAWLFSSVNWRPIAIGALLVAIGPVTLLVWRMLVELVNPNWPAPMESRHVGNGGVGWPWARYRDPDAPEEPEPPPEPRTVLRGVPVMDHGRTRVIALPEAADVDEDDLVEAPSGAHVPADDLRAYVAQAPVTGTSFRVWADRDKWSHEQWRDVVATLARLGILEEPQARHPTAFALKPEEATRVLEEFLDDHPTPF